MEKIWAFYQKGVKLVRIDPKEAKALMEAKPLTLDDMIKHNEALKPTNEKA